MSDRGQDHEAQRPSRFRSVYKALFLGFAFGGLVGPGYIVYCKYWSGSKLGEFKVFNGKVAKIGSFSSESGGEWSLPVQLELDPSMNPVSILSEYRYIAHATPRHNSFECKLTLGGEVVWATTLGHTAYGKKKEKGKSLPQIGKLFLPGASGVIEVFDVEQPGTYELTMVRSKREFTEADITIVSRRNVRSASPAIYIPGIILCLGSFVAMFAVSSVMVAKGQAEPVIDERA